jgi:GTPase SAR1 family protein
VRRDQAQFEPVPTLLLPSPAPWVAFSPRESTLATSAHTSREIRIWEVDATELARTQRPASSVHYVNAKAVLLGDSGVGKSGLARVLLGLDFEPTESTHGRKIWTLASEETELGDGARERRELLLWDLAGQPGYRVFHRQHLHDAAVAMVLFDARSDSEAFAGVGFWARALANPTRAFSARKLLVAARVDRGAPLASRGRVDEVVEHYGFDAYFETSAREGIGVDELRTALLERVPWADLPRITTTQVFYDLKQFLVEQKDAGHVLQGRQDLYESYLRSRTRSDISIDVLDACVDRMETAGLTRRLSFHDLVLLQPELLDAYGSWLAIEARRDPAGLGCISLARVQQGEFQMDSERLLANSPEELQLITATVQELLGRGIAFRQTTEEGDMLVFPSELLSELPDPLGKFAFNVGFDFEGDVVAILATLVVYLSYAPAFTRSELFRNAAIFKSAGGERCGILLEYPDRYRDERGRISVFFDEDAGQTSKLTFLRYIERHVKRMALPDSLARIRIYQCAKGYVFEDRVVDERERLGKVNVICPIHEEVIPIDDLAEQTAHVDAVVDEQLVISRETLEDERRLAALAEREKSDEFHVFLCHNSLDKTDVRKLAKMLRERGILSWIDEDGVLGGEQVVPQLDAAIRRAPAVAVVLGRRSLSRWQEQEFYLFYKRFVEEREAGKALSVIPVLLPGAPQDADVPLSLGSFSRIDFNTQGGLEDRQTMSRLVDAILNARSER